MWAMREEIREDIAKDINGSLDVLEKWSRRGLIGGQIKEKYWTTRWYACLSGWINLHSIFYPKYVYNQFPHWLRLFDYHVGQPVLTFMFGKLIGKWRVFCYRQAYLECNRLYPKAIHCIDYPELFSQKELDKFKEG